MANTTHGADNLLNPASDKKTEMAYVIGGIFIATLLAPMCFLGWSLIKAIFIG
ncbi:hypothetical protein [Mesorhizobium sp. SP-1A]|uniref:hypothetical protein n=1 Tax=Mesorhizobium sp. SP-1A TaxID=3077840 RepID=UPI0028F74532|nr:hypothetical protein [Mesorhizobium sp. SP-1A]